VPAAAAPVAGPSSAAYQKDLDDLRSSVDVIRQQMIELTKEVKAIRTKVGE
jgi:hypothetical protein